MADYQRSMTRRREKCRRESGELLLYTRSQWLAGATPTRPQPSLTTAFDLPMFLTASDCTVAVVVVVVVSSVRFNARQCACCQSDRYRTQDMTSLCVCGAYVRVHPGNSAELTVDVVGTTTTTISSIIVIIIIIICSLSVVRSLQ